MITTSAVSSLIYPCDRSTGLPVGYHKFNATHVGVVCEYCGSYPTYVTPVTFVDEWDNEDDAIYDGGPLDQYLHGRTIEECIMGAAQEVIDNFETTYDKHNYKYDPIGRWVPIETGYVYRHYEPGDSMLGPAMTTTYTPTTATTSLLTFK